MATNPMQRKSRISFLLGMLVMLIIAVIVVSLLFMRLQKAEKDLDEYELNTTEVYILTQDVKSGQLLTEGMFTSQKVPNNIVPGNATQDIYTTLANVKIVDTQKRPINPPSVALHKDYYYYSFEGRSSDAIVYKGDKVKATSLAPGDKAFYYADEAETQKVDIEIANVEGAVAKIDMKANTVITRSTICASDEQITDDLRKEEYNIIALPVDLQNDEYVDIRLRLPNGQNYIVVSKKKVTIPISNGVYLADTIQMNLNEKEILYISSAIVESFQMEGSILYATRYTEAGMQESAAETYVPNSYVITAIKNDANIVARAKQGLADNRKNDIDAALDKYGKEESIDTKNQESIQSSLEERKNYLQSLVPTE